MPDFLRSLPRQSLLLAVVIGIIAERLTWDIGLTGPALLIWLSLLIGAAWWLAHAQQTPWQLDILLWGGIAVTAAALRLWSALPAVDAALFIVMATSAAQILVRSAGVGFRQADIFQQTIAHTLLPFQAWIGGFMVLGGLEIRTGSKSPVFAAVLRGLLIAVPLLLVFMMLFYSADVTFAAYMDELPALVSVTTLQQLFVMLLLGWFTLGLLAASWKQRKTLTLGAPSMTLGTVEQVVAMGLLSLLFVVFAALQLSHLLRDADGIVATTGLGIAEYARHGFFQLVWIAALALAVLKLLAFFAGNQQLYAGFAALLLLCVLIVLASAVQRMLFYVDSFGLSIDRIVACTFMLWLTGCLLLFAATVLRNRSEGFASGVVVLGVGACFALALLNPAALVSRVNIERSLTTSAAGTMPTLDSLYLARMKADAVPALLENFSRLSATAQCEVATLLAVEWLSSDNDHVKRQQDWRRWNRAESRALALIEANAAMLQAKAALGFAQRVDEAGRPLLKPSCPTAP